jgi:Tol biopolymer transport system component
VGVHGDWIYRIDWSADSDVLAFSSISNESARSHVGIWDVTVEEMLYQVHQPSPIFDIALHPDGQFLAVPGIRDGEDWATNPTVPPAVYLVDADAGAFVEEALFEVDHFSISLDWHPDGEYLAEWRLSFIEDERIVAVNIWRWDGDGRAEQVFSFTPAGDYHRTLIEWNAAGDALAMGYFDLEGRVGGVQVWQVSFDPMNAELESVYITEYDEWDELRFGPTVAPWSADGSRLAASVSTREIVVWER